MPRLRSIERSTAETLKQIEGDWRAGILSIRVVAAKYRVDPDALRNFAVRSGWLRGDLGADIDRGTTRAVMERAVSEADRTAGRASAPVVSEKEIVQQYSQIVAGVLGGHREAAERGRSHAVRLEQELSRCIGAIAQESDLKERLALIRSSAETLRAVAVAMKTFIDLERQAWQLDKDNGSGGVSYDDFLVEIYGETASTREPHLALVPGSDGQS
jgi:hypothetical protein